MKKIFERLPSIGLFQGLSESDLSGMLSCLSATVVSYHKNEIIFLPGEAVRKVGTVLSGQVQVFQEDYYGNKWILTSAFPGQTFVESFACSQHHVLPFTVTATQDSEILFLDCARIISPCAEACLFHRRLIENLVSLIAKNNIARVS